MIEKSVRAPCTLVLHNIRSVYNVGSIFRTADAAGVSEIILCGYTPTPLNRFGVLRRDFAKVSLGAEQWIPWRKISTLTVALTQLRKKGYMTVAIEQDARATSFFDWKSPEVKPIAIVLGNEVRGLSLSALRAVDHILEIPMRGKKESLNVSVAAGIALFSLLK